MARITAYEASDGTLHRDKKLFHVHEQNLQSIPKLRDLIAAKTPASDGTPEGEAARNADIESKLAVLTETIGLSTLRDILNVKFEPKTDTDPDDNDGASGSAAAPATPPAQAESPSEI